MNYKSIFISDLHIGSRNSNITKLLEFLKDAECENLFIVGDFIDGWELKHKWFWNNDCNTIIQKLLRKSRKGTNLYLIIGNHDDFLFNFENIEFGNIKILRQYIHTTENNQRVLVIHGDQFDGIIKYAKWIQHIGSFLYDWLITANNKLNRLLKRYNKSVSFAKIIKQNTKGALSFVNKYEECVAKETVNNDCSTVICGHIHMPMHKQLQSIDYFNCGSWQEDEYHAVVEHLDGKLELISIN